MSNLRSIKVRDSTFKKLVSARDNLIKKNGGVGRLSYSDVIDISLKDLKDELQ